MADDPTRGLLLLVLQFLDEQNLSETARSLECESGVFFNMTYFEEMLNCCAYNEAENYLCGFTDIHDNIYSTKLYFGIRKLKFLEAMGDGEREVAREVVEKESEDFSENNEGMVDQAFEMLQMKDFMSHKLMSSYRTMKEARKVVMGTIKRCILENPMLVGKLRFPPLPNTLQQIYMNADELDTAQHSSGGSGRGRRF